MPFRSEKQRRFLWATQPELARRWAHEYPQKKKLPLYAHEDGKESKKSPEKQDLNTAKAAEAIMTNANKLNKTLNAVGLRIYDKLNKKAESAAVKIEIPRSEKPVAAGDEHISAKQTDENNPGAEVSENNESAHVSPLMAKLSVVLSQQIQQAIADDEAAQAGAEAQQVPQNAGLKNYPVGAQNIPPPMGSTPTPAPASQTQDPTGGQGTMPPVGGGSHPSANPINSYGGLSVNGDINGNAAFGAPGGSKTAGKLGLWDRIRAKKERGEKPASPGDKDYPSAKSWKKVTSISEKKSAEDKACSCGCGDTVGTCKCGPDCSCKKPGGSCYKQEKQAGLPIALHGIKTYLSRLAGKSILPFERKLRLADDLAANIHHKTYKETPQITTLMHGLSDGGVGNAGGKSTARFLGGGLNEHVWRLRDEAQKKLWREQAAIKNTRVGTGVAGLGALGAGGLGLSAALSEKQSGTPAWQRSEGKNEEGGLNEKGRKSYEREHGGNLKAPVTEKNPKGKAKKRQNSFCARMCGMKRVNTGAKTKSDPDSRINKSLRKWNCKCSSAMEFGIKMAAPTSSLIPTFQQAAREGLAGMRNRFKILENMRGVSDRLLSGDLYPMPPVDKHINVVNRGSVHAGDVGRVLQRMLKQMRVPADKVQETVGQAPIAWLPTDKRMLANSPQLKQSAAPFGPAEQTGADIGGLIGVPAGGAAGLAASTYLDNPGNIAKLQMTHRLNSAKQTAMAAARKAMGMKSPLTSQLSHLGSKAVLKALQLMPKTNPGRGALLLGLPIASAMGVGIGGIQAGRAIGGAFDAPKPAQ